MSVRIHGAEYPIKKIFSNDFAFTIPLYQRPYSWTTEQAGELLDDLAAVLDKEPSKHIDDLDPYFLGSIVLIKAEDRPDAEVVDGQQRLTTLSILLSALRYDAEDSFAESLREFIYEKGNLVSGTPNRFRLTIRQRDADFFREHIQEDGGLEKLLATDPTQLTDSCRNVRENAELFISQLKKRSPEEAQRLAQFIIQRCFLVAVSTPDLNSAYRIFSVLNERGLDLSHADILKSETIGRIPDAKQEAYADRWEQIEEELGREAFDNLFAHVRMIHGRNKLRITILEGFRQAVIDQYPDPINLIDQVLKPSAEAYGIVLARDFESTAHAESINQMLEWLNRLDNVDWVPTAILTLSKHKSDAEMCLNVLTDLERLAASMLIRRSNINERIERYGKVLDAIDKNEDLFADDSPLQLTKRERVITAELLDGDLYKMKRVRLYVLLRLDSSLSSGGATYNYPLLSVEHVLPQNPDDDSDWVIEFNEEDHEEWVHRLANLVLLTRRKNSAAQNYDFDEKKSRYFTGRGGVSPFQITTQVLHADTWDLEILRERQVELLGKLKKLWRLD